MGRVVPRWTYVQSFIAFIEDSLLNGIMIRTKPKKDLKYSNQTFQIIFFMKIKDVKLATKQNTIGFEKL